MEGFFLFAEKAPHNHGLAFREEHLPRHKGHLPVQGHFLPLDDRYAVRPPPRPQPEPFARDRHVRCNATFGLQHVRPWAGPGFTARKTRCPIGKPAALWLPGEELLIQDPAERSCAFRRSRPGIPSEGGHPFQLKPAGDSDDPGHLLGIALVSAFASVHSTVSASSF
jgi:hypothetical protein